MSEVTTKKSLTSIIVAIVAIVAILIVLLKSLGSDPGYLTSPLIGKKLEDFNLPTLYDQDQTFSKKDLLGNISLVIAWATWCPSCLDEHSVLLKIQQTNKVNIYGINWNDDPEKAKQWLQKLGSPYIKNGSDTTGEVGTEFGIVGAPETFLIDQKGTVILQHSGAISWTYWQQVILPKVNELTNK